MKFDMSRIAQSLLLIMLVGGLLFTQGCGGDKGAGAEGGDSTFAEATAEETDTAEPEEDKQKRPSPPAEASGKIGEVAIQVNYSSPAVKGRTIWGELVPFDAVWRTGANEATVFEVGQDVMIGGKELPAGKYGLFTIPHADGSWTVIFNSIWDQWGAYNYDEAKDVLRVEASATELPELVEQMKFDVSSEGKVTFSWGKMAVSFDVAAK